MPLSTPPITMLVPRLILVATGRLLRLSAASFAFWLGLMWLLLLLLLLPLLLLSTTTLLARVPHAGGTRVTSLVATATPPLPLLLWLLMMTGPPLRLCLSGGCFGQTFFISTIEIDCTSRNPTLIGLWPPFDSIDPAIDWVLTDENIFPSTNGHLTIIPIFRKGVCNNCEALLNGSFQPRRRCGSGRSNDDFLFLRGERLRILTAAIQVVLNARCCCHWCLDNSSALAIFLFHCCTTTAGGCCSGCWWCCTTCCCVSTMGKRLLEVT
mmetsp:Transcript_59887/g.118759  ORF Transcript_59887/g.118759 Transcript_59887/m.118759 type:complete len:267 (+) Transcript_59887:481-1281(+)